MPQYNMNRGNALLNSPYDQNINYLTKNTITKNGLSQNTP
ncbi:hypothetical protein T4B_9055 [Trichinella pseudospiralis]|uniref:Uncharacterized protein n=1 Tax=Trichinella pseudospiralis TaxID=6337 RepID=A0A0V1GD82_TRIPS|nr:hypothetical protein T4B_9055 [Trichinella pseudospiralis]KRY96066.1 hypothetical protein T4C_8062 [Trichinella pseudospiralis]